MRAKNFTRDDQRVCLQIICSRVTSWKLKDLTRDDQRVCLQIICSRVTSWELKTSQEMINAFVYKFIFSLTTSWELNYITRDDQRVCLQIICSRVTSWELKTSQLDDHKRTRLFSKLYVAAWRHDVAAWAKKKRWSQEMINAFVYKL